ncbi:FAD-binding protein [Streptomyces sp. NRRL B-1677]|uniref:FAD-binding oxidoreductase n=1 Tax=Streptomyces sp. NRRL B-1677 TaxID=2682966 RepID=UPI001892C462|nr:FAD-binding oxidoreductase [Streptomyces sp. NRRL B-1677]MBF6049152.1 FAD-binding protein [Streptomyces sp. NRRL B-1677]
MDSAVEPGDIECLRAEITGEVFVPGDVGYDDLTDLIVHTGHPAVIIRVRSNDDVARGIAFAVTHGLEISTRSGGHSNAGFSTNVGGMVLDLAHLNSIEVVDESRRLVRLGAGAKWDQVAAALEPYGLAFTSGDTTSVAVGGLLVGGGVGWLARKYGLAMDSLVAAEVVTADGCVLPAGAEANPDLFWAIRGGGGNFGVVTSFTVVAQPVPRVFFGQISFAPDETAKVLRGWAAYMESAPEELTATAMCWPTFGEATPPLALMVCYAGDDEAAARSAIDPIRKLGTVVDDQVRLMPYGHVLQPASALPKGWRPYVRNRLTPALTGDLVTTVLAEQANLKNLYVEIRSIGGALSRVPEDATAFAHRSTQAMIMGVLLGSPEGNEPLMPAYEAFWSALAPSMSGAYSGFLSNVRPADIDAVYPERVYRRLAALKREYDPGNIFHLNVNVVPAGAEQG